MKKTAKAVCFSLILIRFQAAQASISFTPPAGFSGESFDSPSLSIQPLFDLSATFETPVYDLFSQNFTQYQLPTFEEQRRNQAIQELTLSLQNYADRLPQRISLTWVEGMLCNTLLREAPSVLASVNTLILVSELTQISNRSLVFMYRRAGMV